MRRFTLFASVIVCLGAGCFGLRDDPNLGRACTNTSQCGEGLTCVEIDKGGLQQCTFSCGVDDVAEEQPCPPGFVCAIAEGSGGGKYCFEPSR
jgi:hypothetical protein